MMYEIWLSENHSYFGHGVAHLDDGRRVELKAALHTATYGPDSLLIDDEEHIHQNRFPLRWFIAPDGIDFYSVCSDTPDVYFHNESGSPIRLGEFGVLPHAISAVVELYEPKLLRNRAKCLLCGDILESTSQHDFKTCSCGNLSVDGGLDYIRRECDAREHYEELSEQE